MGHVLLSSTRVLSAYLVIVATWPYVATLVVLVAFIIIPSAGLTTSLRGVPLSAIPLVRRV